MDDEAEDDEVSTAKKVAKKSRTARKDAQQEAESDEEEKEEKEEKEEERRSPRRRAASRKVVYADDSSDEMEFMDSDEEVAPRKKVKGGQKGKAKRGKKGGKTRISGSDSEDFTPGPEEDEDDNFIADTDSDMEAESEEEPPKSRKGRGGKKARPQIIRAPRAAAPDSIEALCAAKAKDIKVLNNPQQFPENGPYVEPVGIDATDGIVEGIIGGMVQKVGRLLQDTLRRPDEEREKGELSFPIRLNTACSGTDAPSIALGLVKESLDRLLRDREAHGFGYEHNMSCEIEPFKQAYIGRNFPGVLLFPDITKLTQEKTVVDVYGRAQTIPEGERWWFHC